MSSELQTGKAHSVSSGDAPDEGIAPYGGDLQVGEVLSQQSGNVLAENWLEMSITDLCKQVYSGGTPKSTVQEYFENGLIPWLKTKEVNYSKITETENFITAEGLKNSSAKLVPVNSVIVAMYGNGDTAGRVAINKIELTTNQACCNLVIDSKRADYRFVYYYLKSQYSKLVDLKNGGAQQNLNAKLIKDYPILVPPIEEQKDIGAFLEALDDRIELLRETNATLEAIAQALFKSWFVDFDPVHANAGTRPATLPPELQALFPSTFTETSQGLVPEGWEVAPFTETINVIGGGTPKTSVAEYWGGDIPWFSVVDAPAASDVFVIDTEKRITELGLNNSSTKLLSAGTTIISARGTVGRLALVGSEMAMNQSCYGLRGKYGDDYFTYFTTCRLVEALKQRSHGSVFDTITRDTLAGVSVVYPDKSVVDAFENAVSPMMQEIKNNLEQSQTLATLRDTLLPRLISGQLRLPEAEALIVEEGV